MTPEELEAERKAYRARQRKREAGEVQHEKRGGQIKTVILRKGLQRKLLEDEYVPANDAMKIARACELRWR